MVSERASKILLSISKRLRQIQPPCVHLQIALWLGGVILMHNEEKLINCATYQGQNNNLKMNMNSIFLGWILTIMSHFSKSIMITAGNYSLVMIYIIYIIATYFPRIDKNQTSLPLQIYFGNSAFLYFLDIIWSNFSISIVFKLFI